MMPELDLATVTAGDGRALLAAAESDWSRQIPHCPGWNAADLIGHMGGILAWMATVVTTGQSVARQDRETPPTHGSALPAWYSANLDRTLTILTTAPTDSGTWTFSSRGDHRVGWWRRRLAVELAIHRWDAQHAKSAGGCEPPASLDATVARSGIEEFLTEFLPRLLAQPEVDGLTGTLHLRATDGPSEWSVDLDARGNVIAIPGHTKADTVIRGTESDLLLWLTNRTPTPSITVLGAADVATGWTQLRR